MLESVIKIGISSDAARPSTPRAVPGPSGKVLPDAGKTSPAQAPSSAKLNLDKVVQQLNLASVTIGSTLRFKVDVLTGDSVILVLDRDTGELIRQIPPEEAVVALKTGNGTSGIQLLDDLA